MTESFIGDPVADCPVICRLIFVISPKGIPRNLQWIIGTVHRLVQHSVKRQLKPSLRQLFAADPTMTLRFAAAFRHLVNNFIARSSPKGRMGLSCGD
jgi:hypothetical protein